jgi:hypothetical protein
MTSTILSNKNRGEEMPLGYVLRKEDILAYYGRERTDVAEALFNYGSDRRVTMTTDPGTLGRGGGQMGFRSTTEVLQAAQKALDGMDGSIPRKYPAFHGTLARSLPNTGFMKRPQRGADLVFDIDVKSNYREAFKEGAKIIKFLDFYNAPYRVKFSGGSGPHIIIPYEAFPDEVMGGRFERAHKTLFQFVSSRSKANHVDGSFTSFGHFYRMPYSLNENTGLVSLPLRSEQYNDFTPSMAEAHRVQIDEEWFKEPDDNARAAIAEMLQDAAGRSRRTARSPQQRPGQPEPPQGRNARRGTGRDLEGLRVDELQRLRDEHMERLRKLVDLGAPSKVVNKEKELLKEAERALRERNA